MQIYVCMVRHSLGSLWSHSGSLVQLLFCSTMHKHVCWPSSDRFLPGTGLAIAACQARYSMHRGLCLLVLAGYRASSPHTRAQLRLNTSAIHASFVLDSFAGILKQLRKAVSQIPSIRALWSCAMSNATPIVLCRALEILLISNTYPERCTRSTCPTLRE